ncbi:FMN-binding negative transcriptional regulator [Tsuneonella rigui]|uniref:FMN-binding negative transcriptional regulator n=1 Tax=Tsuneonella rigui TaxID=1708790 RepID=UPI000F7F63B7|nr:FMN-binding negative transcriptional regulator [Tsuneonella rigui]
MSADFTAVGQDNVARLIAQMPLCWIVPHGDPAAAILMPVVLEPGHKSLLGHLPLRAPATEALRGDPRASFLFLGANGYVSPAHAGIDDWAPTWNFVSAKLTGAVSLDPGLTRDAVEAVVALMEGPNGWNIGAIEHRYDTLAARIVGFRATIEHVSPRFKLGQDEWPEVRSRIADALADTEVGKWMGGIG